MTLERQLMRARAEPHLLRLCWQKLNAVIARQVNFTYTYMHTHKHTQKFWPFLLVLLKPYV
jgi:hypothetical protein